MKAVADAHAAAMMDANPAGPAGSIDECVEYRPVGDRVAAVAHPFGLAVRRGHAPRVEMIAPDHDGRLQFAVAYHLVEAQPQTYPFAVAQPADPRRQSLKVNALPSQRQPPRQRPIAGKLFAGG